MSEQLSKNVQSVNQRIAEAAVRSGRTADDVQLVAVTKYVDANVTEQLVQAGCHCLGESRPQLLWEKGEALSELPIQWHMIGHLQRNKVKRTVAVAELIHSVDSDRLMRAIHEAGKEADRQVRILIEVNVSGESAKQGYEAADLQPALELATTLPNVAVCGLMCMAGVGGDTDEARREFAQLRVLRDQHSDFRTDNVQLDELSMGMSGDFEIAIEEGATIVRVGSLLFKE